MPNNDFPRILTLLRKERGFSQKKAAADLGISQALLSHYEKGVRECGLDFLVRAAACLLLCVRRIITACPATICWGAPPTGAQPLPAAHLPRERPHWPQAVDPPPKPSAKGWKTPFVLYSGFWKKSSVKP